MLVGSVVQRHYVQTYIRTIRYVMIHAGLELSEGGVGGSTPTWFFSTPHFHYLTPPPSKKTPKKLISLFKEVPISKNKNDER
jgi:uracil-DNA glycosylase